MQSNFMIKVRTIVLSIFLVGLFGCATGDYYNEGYYDDGLDEGYIGDGFDEGYIGDDFGDGLIGDDFIGERY